MKNDFQRFLGFVGLTLAVVLVGGALGQRVLFAAAGPDGAIITRMKELERSGLEISSDAGVLVSTKLQYQRISVTLDAAGTRATVTSTLDFTGLLRRSDASVTRVSSLGLERATYVLDRTEWTPEHTDAPRLLRIVQALDARRVALDTGDALAPIEHHHWESQAWFIRSERGEVEVAEDYRLTGTTRERPVDEKATRRLSLQEDADGGFSFPGGLM
jgi:hypothetical protein